MAARGSGKSFQEASWTKPSPTLYFQKIPDEGVLGELQEQLKQQAGYKPPIRLAKGGAICFADFIDTQHATSAMHNLSGQVFMGERLNISYDKDDSEEKRKQKEIDKERQAAQALCERYHCKICGAFVIRLGKPLDKLPRRGTDQSHVADEKKHIVELSVCKGEIKHIKREKGVEQQCRLNCEQCGTVVAYRPKPIGEESKFTYILDDALASKKKARGNSSDDKAATEASALPVPAEGTESKPAAPPAAGEGWAGQEEEGERDAKRAKTT